MVTLLIASLINEKINNALFSIVDDKAPVPRGYTILFLRKTKLRTLLVQTSRLLWDISLPTISCLDVLIQPRLLWSLRLTIQQVWATSYRSRVVIYCTNASQRQLWTDLSSSWEDKSHITSFLFQELLRNYHLDGGPHKCTLKLDIHKAFDSLNWNFIWLGLRTICIPDHMFRWIDACMRIGNVWLTAYINCVSEYVVTYDVTDKFTASIRFPKIFQPVGT